jgi:lipoprotein-anchoring transpeptidase ErfK/SrfK
MLPSRLRRLALACAPACAVVTVAAAQAQTLSYAPQPPRGGGTFQEFLQEPTRHAGEAAALPQHLRRQIVAYNTREPAGTIVVDTANTSLYYVLGGGKAVRYGIGVGREGFTWSGVKSVERKAEWPDWIPPEQMIARQPYLPRWMAGGPGNPMGARALYLGGSLYRIHGTNEPWSIGRFVSSGCIRMLNEDVIDLYERVRVGTRVVVLPGSPRSAAAARTRATRAAAEAPSEIPTHRTSMSGVY